MKPFACLTTLSLLAGAFPALPSTGWHFGRTGLGLTQYFLDDQAPDKAALGRSRPWGLALSQEFYKGAGFQARLEADLAWEEEQETCFFMCVDFNYTGRYFWSTRYGGAGLRLNPDGFRLLDGFGVELGYARFMYHWGVAREGLDSPLPEGQFIAGTYESHQMVLGVDYQVAFRKACWSFVLETGVKKTLAAHNTFAPALLVGDAERFSFPERPLGVHLTLKMEL